MNSWEATMKPAMTIPYGLSFVKIYLIALGAVTGKSDIAESNRK